MKTKEATYLQRFFSRTISATGFLFRRFSFEVLLLLVLFSIASCSNATLESDLLEDADQTYELIDPVSVEAILGVNLALEEDEVFTPGALVYESVYESGAVIEVIKDMSEYAFIGKIVNHPSDGVICNTVMGIKEYYAPCEGHCVVVCDKSNKP